MKTTIGVLISAGTNFCEIFYQKQIIALQKFHEKNLAKVSTPKVDYM